jgi:subtilase family serine protease
MLARRFFLSAFAAGLLLTLMLVSATGGTVQAAGDGTTHLRTGHSGAFVVFASRLEARLARSGSKGAPSDSQCRKDGGLPCYSPQEIRHAYGVDELLAKGDDGAGETIVIVDSYGSPTLRSDLATFDAGYGLPAPPSLKILAPLGAVAFDPNNSDMVGWALETTLDVEWSHAMAPGAGIVVLTSPVDETEGVQGLPQFDELENYALDHHLGEVISQSWSATENTLFTPSGEQVIANFERTYTRAAAMGVTVLAAAGDSGSSNLELNGTSFYPFPTVGFPASSPLVTAVGGTSLDADTSGDYKSETVWNDSETGDGAGGGGISRLFAEPSYQRQFLSPADQKLLGGKRGLPDVSWNADPYTAIAVYASVESGESDGGYYMTGGTSEGSPEWAGLICDLDQMVGHPLGFLNPELYGLGAARTGFHDITIGNNSYNGVPGYGATPGWDLASGWGTPNSAELISSIGALAKVGRAPASGTERDRGIGPAVTPPVR